MEATASPNASQGIGMILFGKAASYLRLTRSKYVFPAVSRTAR